MKLEEMQTTADALRWALNRLEMAGVDWRGDYFARANAILADAILAQEAERDALHAEIESAQQAQRDAENELSRTKALHDLRMLRNAVDAMMAVIGYSIIMDGRVQRVMDAMAASDWAAVLEANEEQDEQP